MVTNESRLKSSDVSDLLKRYLPDSDPVIRDMTPYHRAMVHRSSSTTRDSSYERLEFLGDAVLNLVTASYLYDRYPNEDEGFMTRMRTQLINGKMLADLCLRHTSLHRFISASEKVKGGGVPYNILEDVFEAFLGAVYIDSGFETAKKWLICLWESSVDFSELASKQDGLKAKLNRYCMQYLGYVPKVEDLGGGSAAGWSVRISSPDDTVIATGTSKDRKVAEENAIKRALQYYGVP